MSPVEVTEKIATSVDSRGLAMTIAIIFVSFVSFMLFLLGLHLYRKYAAKPHSHGDLKDHPIFARLQHQIKIFIPALPIKERLRRAIFRDFLAIKFQEVHDVFLAVARREDLNDLSEEALCSMMKDSILNIVSRYEAMAVKTEIPAIVLELFSNRHNPTITHLNAFIEDVCQSDWYDDNVQKIATIFNFTWSILSKTIIDAEKTMHTINGQLDNVVYKGITSEKKSRHA